MSNPVYINAGEFMQMLKQNDLIIVSVAEFEATKTIDRKRLMKRKSLSLKEIVDNKLLPIGTKKGLMGWITSGKIKPDETYNESASPNRIMILTSAIKRLGYEE